MDYVTVEERQLITDDFSDLVGDAECQVAITYRVFVSRGTFNPATGIISETYTNSSINSFRFPLREDEIINSGGIYQKGDYRYMMRVSDIATPKKDDRLIDGSVTRYPFEWSTDPLNIFHVLVARKI